MKRLKILQYIALPVFMGVLAWQIWKSPTEFWARIVNVHWQTLLFVFICLALGQVMLTTRQLLLLRHAKVSISWGRLWSITYAGHFMNNFLPGGTGFDLTRLYYMKKASNRSTAELGSIVLLDRLTGLAGLAVLVIPFSAIYYLKNKAILSLLWSSQFSIILLVFIPLAFLSVLLLLRYDWPHRVGTSIATRFPFLFPLESVVRTLKLYAHRRRLLLGVLGISALSHFLATVGIYCIADALFNGHQALESMLLSPLVFLSSAIPVSPGNIGWTETVAIFLWKMFDIQGGMLIFLFWRVLYATYSIGGGIAYLFLNGEVRAASEN